MIFQLFGRRARILPLRFTISTGWWHGNNLTSPHLQNTQFLRVPRSPYYILGFRNAPLWPVPLVRSQVDTPQISPWLPVPARLVNRLVWIAQWVVYRRPGGNLESARITCPGPQWKHPRKIFWKSWSNWCWKLLSISFPLPQVSKENFILEIRESWYDWY